MNCGKDMDLISNPSEPTAYGYSHTHAIPGIWILTFHNVSVL